MVDLAAGVRFAEQRIELTDPAGVDVVGEVVAVPSANPVNYHQVISDHAACPPITIDGQLFVPTASGGPHATVIVVPGSLGVGPNHLAHAETLFAAGWAVFVIDPFGPRAVASTVSNQTQYSFAASAYDVLAAVGVLAARPELAADRIAAQGHSRGGSAVTTAAMRRFADAVLGPDQALAAVYAAYPWCGHQFVDASIGPTAMRAIVGDQDDWLSVQQVQAQIATVAATGAAASVRVVPGAAHSFDRTEPVTAVPDASVAPTAPTIGIADDGALIDPYSGLADAHLADRDVFVQAIKHGFGVKGAHYGGSTDTAALFTADMLDFYRNVL
ncbi:MAG: dienelactone hydrolase family protein [Actinomycetota bacterium]